MAGGGRAARRTYAPRPMSAGAAPLSPPTDPSGGARTSRGSAPGSMRSGLVALAAVQVCFGLFPVFGGLAMDPVHGFSPFAVTGWRIGIGAVVLLLLAGASHGRRARPERRDRGRLAAFAVLGIVLNQALFLVGLQRSTPMNAGLVICLIPVFAYAIAVVLGRERLHGTRALGVLVALGGAVPLFRQSLSSSTLRGAPTHRRPRRSVPKLLVPTAQVTPRSSSCGRLTREPTAATEPATTASACAPNRRSLSCRDVYASSHPYSTRASLSAARVAHSCTSFSP